MHNVLMTRLPDFPKDHLFATAKDRLYIVKLTLLFIGAVFAVYLATAQPKGKIDWLRQSDWTYFTGAQQTEYGIKIFPTKREINHRDTSTAQPNPPVNIRGSYLKVDGPFRIDMSMSGVNNEATVQFYGQVPVIYDEWRHERPSIRISVTNDEVYVRIWDGSAVSSIDERKFKVKLKNDADLTLVHSESDFSLHANGKTLGTIPDHSIFNEGTIWFGADAKYPSEGWSLRSLTASGFSENSLKLEEPLSSKLDYKDAKSLRALAEKNPRNIPIGVAVSVNPLFTDSRYREIVLGQFNMITPENSFKPQTIHPLPDLYLFNETDSLVEAAQNNGMILHGHSLVMGKANPEWMQKTDKTERQQMMIDHITTIVGRYNGEVSQWDVVNEPLSEDNVDYSEDQKGIRRQMWSDAMGEQYIDIAFSVARAADPKAKLFLNDFGLENDGHRWEAFLSLIKRLKSRGVPIDGVGFEAHVYHSPADTINPSTLKRHIQELAALGVESRISEIDVLGDNPEFQAQQYSDVMRACLSEPTCTSYGIWGITDLYGSTALSDRYPVMSGDSLPWDKDYNSKLTLDSLRSVLLTP